MSIGKFPDFKLFFSTLLFEDTVPFVFLWYNGRRVKFYSMMVCRVVVFLILLVYAERRWTIYIRVKWYASTIECFYIFYLCICSC